MKTSFPGELLQHPEIATLLHDFVDAQERACDATDRAEQLSRTLPADAPDLSEARMEARLANDKAGEVYDRLSSLIEQYR